MKLIMGTTCHNEGLDPIPGLAVAVISEQLIKRIYRFKNAVELLDCYSITDWNYNCEFKQWAEDDEGNEIPGKSLRVEFNELVVTDTHFYWRCAVKHTDVVLATEWQEIASLPNPNDDLL